MKLKYYLRGMGVGMILTAIIMGIALHGRTETLSDAEIMARARELGMIDSTVLSDYAAQGSSGDAMGGGGENGNAADGSAQASVKSVSQMGESGSRRVVFEKLKPEDDATAGSARDTTGGAAGKGSSLSGTGSSVAAAASATGKSTADTAASKSAVVMKSDVTTASSKATGASVTASTAGQKATEAGTKASTGSTSAAKPAETAVAAATAGTAASKPAETSAASGASENAGTGASVKTETAAASNTASTVSAKPAETAVASNTASTAAAPAAPAEPAAPAAPAVTTASGRTITIPSGVGSDTVARLLEQAGIVSSASEFDAYLCDRHVDRILHSGTKTIPEGASFEEIAGILTR
ncbi:MAG: hypothetical protein IKO80_10750 [Lachnospiraceae bacterium]|nr:hypothetical protein [Lachnospiraceae bacterium]